MADGRTTPLYDWHVGRGAKMVPFAGWLLPIQYPTGIVAEHHACRNEAALFDVSHMGQVWFPGDPVAAAEALERVLPSDLRSLKEGRAKYTVLLTDEGTIEDDLIVARREDGWGAVVNASRTAADLAFLERVLPVEHRPVLRDGRALLALQGPAAEDALAALLPDVRGMRFLDMRAMFLDGQSVTVARLGYTGADGFEIDVPEGLAVEVAELLTANPGVVPAGLGARDSLRLEAGLCLYGHDIDSTTTPSAAGLGWTIPKRRREAGDFPGAARIVGELRDGAPRQLVGLRIEGRLPAREGALVFAASEAVGRVTSGGFSPTLGHPIALAYVDAAHAAPGTELVCQVRQHDVAAAVTGLPFVPHTYQR
jgi:aminomethyltransferase